MDVSHATPELFKALSLAQGEIENAGKNAANPHFKSKYADLAEILNTLRPVFAKHGLALTQAPSFDGSMASVTTLVSHESGGYITAEASCVPAKSDAQGIGSATTYLRRYSAAAAAGIAQEDDDGNAARHDGKPEPVSKANPLDGVWDALDEATQAFLLKMAAEVIARIQDPADAYEYVVCQDLPSTEMAGLWTQLPSNVRSALKKAKTEYDKRKQGA